MIVTSVAVSDSHWNLHGALKEILTLPRARSADKRFLIGTIGTRRAVEVRGNKTKEFAQTLAELAQPIMLVDVRRKGMGGSGSWGPTEFATLIPGHLKAAGIVEYSFHHLPLLGPSLQLFESSQSAEDSDRLSEEQIEAAVQQVVSGHQPPQPAWKHWQVFRAAYHRELSHSEAVPAARAFVEAAREQDGIVVFLCAEERRNNFQHLPQHEQDGCYCHRFTLANEVARSIQREFCDADIRRVDLAIGEQSTERVLSRTIRSDYLLGHLTDAGHAARRS